MIYKMVVLKYTTHKKDGLKQGKLFLLTDFRGLLRKTKNNKI